MKINERQNYDDNIQEIIISLVVDKRASRKDIPLVSDLLSDIRAITRVTIVDPIESDETETKKKLNVKVKFNTKKMGTLTPKTFINKILIPTIKNLESRPSIVGVTKPTDHI